MLNANVRKLLKINLMITWISKKCVFCKLIFSSVSCRKAIFVIPVDILCVTLSDISEEELRIPSIGFYKFVCRNTFPLLKVE